MRWLLRSLFGVALLTALAVGLIFAVVAWLERGRFFQDRLERELARYLDGHIAVTEAELSVVTRRFQARGVEVEAEAGAAPALRVPRLVVDLGLPQDGRMSLERVEVWRPQLEIVERGDGTFSPFDLVKPPPVGVTVPVVAVREGTARLSGRGDFTRMLNGILRADLPRRFEEIEFTTYPVPRPSPFLFGFAGTLRLPEVGTLRYHGGVGRDQSFDFNAELRGLRLDDDALLRCLAPDLQRSVSRSVRGGSVDLTFALRIAGTDSADRSGMSLRLELKDVEVAAPYCSAPLRVAHAVVEYDGFTVDLRDAEVVGLGESVRVDGRCHPRAAVAGLDDFLGDYTLRVRGDALHFDRLAAAVTEPHIRRAIDDFDPRGPFALELELTREGARGPRYEWTVRPLGGSGSYVGHEQDGRQLGFPYRIHDLRGVVRGDNERIDFLGLRGWHGPARVQVDGAWTRVGEEDFHLELAVSAEGVEVDEEVLAGLEHGSPGAREIVDRFGSVSSGTLAATVDAEVKVRSDGTAAGRWHRVLLRFADGRCLPEFFPYPLQIRGGRLELTPDEVLVQGIVARGDRVAFRVDGRVEPAKRESDEPPPPAGLDLRVEATGLRLEDGALRHALTILAARDAPDPVEARRALEDWLPPSGRADALVEIEAEVGERPRFRARADARDVDVAVAPLPVHLSRASARLDIDNDTADRSLRLRIDDVVGGLGPASVAASVRVDDRRLEALAARGEEVPIDAALRSSVAELVRVYVRDPSAVLWWLSSLGDRGVVSFRVDDAGPTGAPGTIDLSLRDAEFRHPQLPGGAVAPLAAELRIDLGRGRVDVMRLEGSFAGGAGGVHDAQLSIDLSDARMRVAGTAALTDLPFDATLARSLVEPSLRELFAERAGSGRFDLDVSRFVWESESSAREAQDGRLRAYHAEVRLDDCALRSPLDIDRIFGVVHLYGREEGGRLVHHGEVENVALRLNRLRPPMEGAAPVGLAIDRLSARLRVDDDAFELTELTGELAGGRLPAHGNRLRVGCADGAFDGAFLLERASLRSVVGWLSEAKTSVDGVLRFDFSYHGDSLSDLAGVGFAQVEDGRLWELPLLAEVYRYTVGVAVGGSRRPVFPNGQLHFELKQGTVILHNLALDAPVGPMPVGLKLEGDGVVDFQGNVRLRIDPTVISAEIPLVTPVIEAIKRRLVSYEVSGTLQNPSIRYDNPVGGLFSLFSGDEEDALRRPRLPPRVSKDWSKRF